MIDLENIQTKFATIVSTPSWKNLEKVFTKVEEVYIISHGGNLAITRHLATDLTRLSKNKLKVVAPDTDTVAIWHGDYDYSTWLETWLDSQIKNDSVERLVIGVSSSGASPDVEKGLNYAVSKNIPAYLISGKEVLIDKVENINLKVSQYFIGEALVMLLGYKLFDAAGFHPPKLKTLVNKEQSIRENSNPDETSQIGIDFDGVIHANSKGFYDGTIYDKPLPGALEALKELSKEWGIVIYTAKAKFDRPLLNGKTGTKLVWEWLEKYDVAKYVKEVTAEKPRAVVYIDDKAVRFKDWSSCIEDLKELKLL